MLQSCNACIITMSSLNLGLLYFREPAITSTLFIALGRRKVRSVVWNVSQTQCKEVQYNCTSTELNPMLSWQWMFQLWPSGMWCCIVGEIGASTLKESGASIYFFPEDGGRKFLKMLVQHDCNVMTHRNTMEENWEENRRMEWVVFNLHMYEDESLPITHAASWCAHLGWQ